MKKSLIFLMVLLLSLATVSAYNAFIVFTVDSISISGASGTCTGISGTSVAVTTEGGCSCSQPSGITSLTVGQQYATGACSCSDPQGSYQTNISVSVTDTANRQDGGNLDAGCLSGSSSQVDAFTLSGCTCAGYPRGYIGSTGSQESVVFDYTITT